MAGNGRGANAREVLSGSVEELDDDFADRMHTGQHATLVSDQSSDDEAHGLPPLPTSHTLADEDSDLEAPADSGDGYGGIMGPRGAVGGLAMGVGGSGLVGLGRVGATRSLGAHVLPRSSKKHLVARGAPDMAAAGLGQPQLVAGGSRGIVAPPFPFNLLEKEVPTLPFYTEFINPFILQSSQHSINFSRT